MHQISKNWECVFYFQYKVATGQCALTEDRIVANMHGVTRHTNMAGRTGSSGARTADATTILEET